MPSEPSHDGAPFRLLVGGTVCLQYHNRTLRMGKKGLALLCRLGLDGTARREAVADLLWEGPSANDNLRVLLSRLRRVFSERGYAIFDPGQDPLVLPECIAVPAPDGSSELAAGFEAVSPRFSEWLAHIRSRMHPEAGADSWTDRVAESLLAGPGRPSVIVLDAEPGVAVDGIVHSLARRLQVPVANGAGVTARSVRFVSPGAAMPVDEIDRLLDTRDHGVWLLERSAFGEDPEWLMEVRSRARVDTMRYRQVPFLTWDEARDEVLFRLGFAEAARLFVHSGGHPAYLRDLLALRPGSEFPRRLPTPKHTASAYLLVARRTLSTGARQALERLAVHPGALQEPLIHALDSGSFIHELERQRWLTFDAGWRFTSEAA